MKTLQDPEGIFAPLVEPVANAYGCRLVHVRQGGSQAGAGNALEIFLERLDGEPLSMDDCATVSREVAAILDVEDTIKAAYRLEVGSPGLERQLTIMDDFIRFKGFDVKLEFKRPLSDGQKRMRATIVDANADGFKVIDDQKREFDLLISDLSSAKMVATEAAVKLVQKGLFPKPINIIKPDTNTEKEALEA